jgi:hypothetical protein
MLQGSLDNFALDEVLGLLSSTSKTGRLDLEGDRGTGSLALNQGQLVDALASNTANGTAPEDVLFELLRFGDGTFNFTATDTEVGDTSRDVAEVLAAAEERLADWRTIEAVVPSLTHVVTPAAELPSDEVTLNRQEWSALIVISGGCPVSEVCDELDLGEVEGSRQIKGLVERKLVDIGSSQFGQGEPAARSGVESLTAQPNDPFARRALQAARKADPEAKRSPPASPARPAATPILQDAGPSERVPATAGAAAIAGSAGIDRRGARPPTPPPPSPEQLAGAAAEGGDGPVPPPTGADAGADGGGESGEQEPAKAGGLLMRYLKSDG